MSKLTLTQFTAAMTTIEQATNRMHIETVVLSTLDSLKPHSGWNHHKSWVEHQAGQPTYMEDPLLCALVEYALMRYNHSGLPLQEQVLTYSK